MDDSAHKLMLRIFKNIPDPRMQGKVTHKLHDILVIATCSIIAGIEYWTQMEDYAKANYDWFAGFLELPNGIPSHDTFGNVFAVLSPDEFEKAIQLWISSHKFPLSEIFLLYFANVSYYELRLFWSVLCQF